jgi:hypothetical protein
MIEMGESSLCKSPPFEEEVVESSALQGVRYSEDPSELLLALLLLLLVVVN